MKIKMLTDVITLNCEQYLRKYPGRGIVYDFTNTYIWVLVGMLAGYVVGKFT